eukprot:CAMPEP_0178516916 /NCGR_PEP_ID=MMETSP0696-20121128/25393_1 /TAXON_ID=265572 /ORGANISM="Extubocellulus spinifer, Strain CCMP396" /LENGTH=292 /DNA_ID=CAMNT_0020147273 /DNA_START=65 /DNA_END=943 /DNA_ORIENTATION=-
MSSDGGEMTSDFVACRNNTICATPPRSNTYTNVTPIDRLTTELRRARVVYDSDYIHEQANKRLTFGSSIDVSAKENDDADAERNADVDECVDNTKHLSEEMKLAGKEILEASKRAETFLADLECRHDKDEERDAEGSSRQAISVPNTNGIRAHPASSDCEVHSLLQEIAVLKRHVKEAKEEVAELRSALSSRSYATQSLTTLDTRRRVIPEEVLLTKEIYADGDTQSNISSIRHHDYRNYKEEGNDEDDSDSVCGIKPCMFGGLIKMIFRESKESAAASRTILSRHEEEEEE